ncbi:helix-turn-helix transcriptional regulator [Rikenella microfusus]|uniref:helix-turn-helix transcriptional regulator n=1 Tax=Rikenella microfusus TaxID=28139 RepID=UPI001DA92FDB|nr:helix-turn-helix transcriptional regulator [Rikenella microfusus]HJE88946.1 helix-turn-helix transcriptional regulator [Rikenella microfusus]
MKNAIKTERARSHMTQQELADKAGVSRQTINYIETQRYVPSVIVALKIAAVFGQRLESLFFLEHEGWE